MSLLARLSPARNKPPRTAITSRSRAAFIAIALLAISSTFLLPRDAQAVTRFKLKITNRMSRDLVYATRGNANADWDGPLVERIKPQQTVELSATRRNTRPANVNIVYRLDHPVSSPRLNGKPEGSTSAHLKRPAGWNLCFNFDDKQSVSDTDHELDSRLAVRNTVKEWILQYLGREDVLFEEWRVWERGQQETSAALTRIEPLKQQELSDSKKKSVRFTLELR